MARVEPWLLPWLLVGCNAVFGIQRHDYSEPQTTIADAGSAGSAVADAGAAGTAGASGAFVALWRFETLRDDRTPSEGDPSVPFVVQQGELSNGPTGNYLMLGGSGSAVTSRPVIDASASFSISAWVRLDRADVWSTFVSQDGRAISSFFLQKRDSNFLAFTTYSSDSVAAEPCIATSGLRPRQGEWYHVVATRDSASGEQRIYVDGILSGKATCAGGFQTDGPLVVGRGKWNNTPADWLDGGVDELGISDRVLTASEIVDLYRLGRPQAHNYLYGYFQEVEEGRGDGLHFAHSHDGLSWNPVGAGKLFLSPEVGGKSFRDPHLMRDPAGKYQLVWTSSCVPWASEDCVQDHGFGHATSDDLVTFSAQTFIEVPPEKLDAQHFWAPETFYDAESQQFLVSWASPLVTPNPALHSIYYLLTKDFLTFSDPAPLYARPDHDVIDATIIKQGPSYYMFMKDETAGQKNLRVVASPSLFGDGAWAGEPSAPLTGMEPAEGPSPLIQGGQLLLLFDRYDGSGLGALRSRDLATLTDVGDWEDVSSTVFAAPLRHGSVIELPEPVFRAVALRAAQ
jgi:hypothetical protein